jgi:hypothetical protein
MLYNPWVATAFYGAFALFAFAATVGKPGKTQVGITLALCWLASLGLWLGFPVEWRPAIFPILDVIFALTAAKAYMETGSKAPLLLVGLSVLAISASLAFVILLASGISTAGSWRHVIAYEISLNVIFVFQCIVTGGWGVADVVGRLVRFDRSASDSWRGAESARHKDAD